MTSAVAVPEELRPELTATPEWHSVWARQHNAIIEGPEHATEGLLRLLAPSLRNPAIWLRAPTSLDLPPGECVALVLRNVCALDRREQARLLKWLDTGRKQVVSTTVGPLFSLVLEGLFNEALYYRLNVMLMRIDSTGAPT